MQAEQNIAKYRTKKAAIAGSPITKITFHGECALIISILFGSAVKPSK